MKINLKAKIQKISSQNALTPQEKSKLIRSFFSKDFRLDLAGDLYPEEMMEILPKDPNVKEWPDLTWDAEHTLELELDHYTDHHVKFEERGLLVAELTSKLQSLFEDLKHESNEDKFIKLLLEIIDDYKGLCKFWD